MSYVRLINNNVDRCVVGPLRGTREGATTMARTERNIAHIFLGLDRGELERSFCALCSHLLISTTPIKVARPIGSAQHNSVAADSCKLFYGFVCTCMCAAHALHVKKQEDRQTTPRTEKKLIISKRTSFVITAACHIHGPWHPTFTVPGWLPGTSTSYAPHRRRTLPPPTTLTSPLSTKPLRT